MSKGFSKGKLCGEFRPVTCLPLKWKLLTGIISEDMTISWKMKTYCQKSKEEQNGCRRKSKGTKNQLLIDMTLLKDSRKRRTNLAMAWIDYRKTYGCVTHSWILECLDMLGIADNVRIFLEKSMKKWKLLLSSNEADLCEVDINRGISQGDSLSPLIFVICMIPMSLFLRKVKASYEWGRKEKKLNHLLFTDDLKLF